MTPNDTIASIATPPGEGGLAVLRLSGADSLAIADRCFTPASATACKPSDCPTHTLHYGHVMRDGEVVDEVLLAVMRGPRTFTREDVVEVSCHGGVLSAKRVLDTLLSAGARLAEPGEFTRRAFLNGRLDLAQAEAVADLIHARTELALNAAQEQLAGHLSRRINHLRDDLMSMLAHVEAHIDFPDEDISPDTLETLMERLRRGEVMIEELLRTADEGRVLRRGIRAAIVGRPNAGKSSLLNALLGEDRAIVAPNPGTTRDTIEETANIRGVPVIFVDTAGLRDAQDDVEAEGVRRTLESIKRAEIILHVLDGSQALEAEDKERMAMLEATPCLTVVNKADLPQRLECPGVATLEVSCLTGAGMESLKDRIKALAFRGALDNVEVAINSRHQEALRRGREALGKVSAGLRESQTLELTAFDLRVAVNAVGEVVGKTTTEDLLDSIFSQFCLGK